MSTFIWTDGIESALDNIYNNSVKISEYHNTKYHYYKGFQKYFRVPIIILSGMNSVFSVGLQPFFGQGLISVLCCGISLICGIISSIELFVGIQNMMEKELLSSKEFYILSCDIFKITSVERQYRSVDGYIYLDNINTKYCNLINQSNLIDQKSKEFHLEIKNVFENNKNLYKTIENIVQEEIIDNIENV